MEEFFPQADATIKLQFGSGLTFTVKKRLATFPSPAGMSLTKLSIAGYNLIISGQGEFFIDILAGDAGKSLTFLYSVFA